LPLDPHLLLLQIIFVMYIYLNVYTAIFYDVYSLASLLFNDKLRRCLFICYPKIIIFFIFFLRPMLYNDIHAKQKCPYFAVICRNIY
jgi:hypothetical protein